MFTVTKVFKFSGAHQICALPENHKCSRVHGHNYEVHFTFAGKELDSNGFIVDVSALGRIKKYIDEHIDHRFLNEVFDFTPSSESLAAHFFFYAKRVCELPIYKVKVQETDTIYAEYFEHAL